MIAYVSIDLWWDHIYLCSSNIVFCEKHLRLIVMSMYMSIYEEEIYCVFCIQVHRNKLRRQKSTYNLTVCERCTHTCICEEYFPKEF